MSKKYRFINALLSIIMAVVMLFSISIPTYANDADVVISGAEVIVKPGETVDVPIVIEKNTGFASLYLYFTYSDDLTFVSLTNEVDDLANTNGVASLWDGATDYTGTGNLAILKFKVPDTAEYGTKYPITINFIEAYDIDYNEVNVSISEGTILVGCPYGDANGNHVDADGDWESDEVYHFRTCGCGTVFDSAKHSGGSATCKEKAKCETCGQEYGALDADNHSGGTSLVNEKEANHKNQTNGYTGDTKCLGCNEIIAYGQTIPVDAHTPSSTWSKDAQYHWKVCSVENCDVVIANSKEAHDYKYTLSKEPTLDDVGTLTGVCDICQDTTIVDLPKLNESDYTYSEVDPPSYTETGKGRYTWNITTYGSFSFDVTLDKLVNENVPQIVVLNAKGFVAETVTVTVNLKNNPGFSGLNMYLTYSDDLTLVEATNVITDLTFTNDRTMVWDAASNYSEDGELLKLTFSISEDAEVGEHFVKANFIEAYTVDETDVVFTTVNGCVEVVDFTYGDANNDGVVNTKDIIRIRRYVAAKDPITGESTVEVSEGADANGDGVINTKDIIRVRRHVAAKDPVTGESSVVLGPTT